MNESELKSAINDNIVKTTTVIVCHPVMIRVIENDGKVPDNFLFVSNSNQDANKAYMIEDEDLKRLYLMQAGRLM